MPSPAGEARPRTGRAALVSPTADTSRSDSLFVCPACAGEFVTAEDEWRCSDCNRAFPVVAGITDLRHAYEDPYVSRDEDLQRARELEQLFESRDLLGLLQEHCRRSGKPTELAERFLAGDRAAESRSAAYLDAVEERRGAPLTANDRVLEVGCGTAALAAAAARRAGAATASDISMRWLVLAKKRLAQLDVRGVTLVCWIRPSVPARSR